MILLSKMLTLAIHILFHPHSVPTSESPHIGKNYKPCHLSVLCNNTYSTHFPFCIYFTASIFLYHINTTPPQTNHVLKSTMAFPADPAPTGSMASTLHPNAPKYSSATPSLNPSNTKPHYFFSTPHNNKSK
jgi:hypothetical protein